MLELRILSGLHRGAAFPLDGETIRLGSNPDNDLVLGDPGMPDHAAAFTRGDDGTWSCRIGSTAHPIVVGAGARLAIGPVSAGIADEDAPWDGGPTPPAPATTEASHAAPRTLIGELACLAAGCAILLGAALAWTFSFDAQGPSAVTGGRPSASGHASSATAPRTAEPVEAAVYPSPMPVASVPLDLLSVRRGRHGFVVTNDGQVLAPGYRWRDYILERIEPRKIVLSGAGVAELAW